MGAISPDISPMLHSLPQRFFAKAVNCLQKTRLIDPSKSPPRANNGMPRNGSAAI
jgi:hypothetical protein